MAASWAMSMGQRVRGTAPSSEASGAAVGPTSSQMGARNSAGRVHMEWKEAW